MKFRYRNQKNAEAISRIWNKPLDKPDWFKAQAAAEGDSEILIYDFIGWPFNDPRELIAALSGMQNVTVRINSPGGDVFDGMAIYNAL
ncbi:MAG: ATP-dependent Clp protease proteolytic subunit, partial [Candidatus Omnitrophica bacterium]|nr:ATP-dependent Clp protease proteolytic subunit [Candidatus Omnitrophota bacterium]